MDAVRKFFVFKKIDSGLLFERLTDVVPANPKDLAHKLSGTEDVQVTFDFREKVRVETKTHVFEEDGFHKE